MKPHTKLKLFQEKAAKTRDSLEKKRLTNFKKSKKLQKSAVLNKMS